MCRVPWGSAGVLGPVVPRVRVVPAGSLVAPVLLVPPVLWSRQGRQGRGVERVEGYVCYRGSCRNGTKKTFKKRFVFPFRSQWPPGDDRARA